MLHVTSFAATPAQMRAQVMLSGQQKATTWVSRTNRRHKWHVLHALIAGNEAPT